MKRPIIVVRDKTTNRNQVINLADLDDAQHEIVVPDITDATRTTMHTKYDKDRAIAKEIHGRHQF